MPDPDPHSPITAETSDLVVSDSEMANLFGVAEMTEAQTVRLGWEPPTIEMLQRLLPDYDFLNFVARGGMGAVYKAVQRNLQRTVAIKILPPEVTDAGDFNYAERFKQEARAMARLRHPGLVAVHESGETSSGLLYIAMEFVDGKDVAQLVRSEEKLAPDLVLKIAAGVCDALSYAHANGVVHRDIKPSNVMLDKNGRVKVADFGLAKITSAESYLQTHSNLALGTPDFAAPEARIPGMPVDQRADLYALGVMLYQMLTGKIPRGAFDPPSATEKSVDPRFDAVIDKAMQVDREKRYSTALELHADLDLIRTHPVSEPVKRKRPHRMALAGIMAVGALLALGIFFVSKRPQSGAHGRGQPAGNEPSPEIFTNSLGMKFVPVPGTNVLFCIHETRYKDYLNFAAAVPSQNKAWAQQTVDGFTPAERPEDHPVIKVTWNDAQAFCAWLSQKEGRTYRLPTDKEWSYAVGIGDKEKRMPETTPQSLLGKDQIDFPWGDAWPIPAKTGNYSDQSRKARAPIPSKYYLDGPNQDYDDGFPTTAPVMSFQPDKLGLYDMSGNVWEFCEDWYDSAKTFRTLRGGSWHDAMRFSLLSSGRYKLAPAAWDVCGGFRVVLSLDKQSSDQEAAPASIPQNKR